MKLRHKPAFPGGFTLVEILVAMVVLAVGLLGMAAMTVLVVRGNKGAGDLTSATNVTQLRIESLKDVPWEELGEATTGQGTPESIRAGRPNGGLEQETELNGEGRTRLQVAAELGVTEPPLNAEVTRRGPYKFTRTFLICDGSDYSPTNAPPAGTDVVASNITNCEVDIAANQRTQWVACAAADITTAGGPDNREKKIKVLTTWRSGDGQCHFVHLDTTVVRL